MRAYRDWWPESSCSSGTIQQDFREQSRKAKKHCQTCPVKRDCLNYALLYDEDGIWGGTTESDRAQILSKVPQLQHLLKLEALREGILEHRYTMEEYWASVREARKLAHQGASTLQQPDKALQLLPVLEPIAEEFVVPEEEYYIQWVS